MKQNKRYPKRKQTQPQQQLPQHNKMMMRTRSFTRMQNENPAEDEVLSLDSDKTVKSFEGSQSSAATESVKSTSQCSSNAALRVGDITSIQEEPLFEELEVDLEGFRETLEQLQKASDTTTTPTPSVSKEAGASLSPTDPTSTASPSRGSIRSTAPTEPESPTIEVQVATFMFQPSFQEFDDDDQLDLLKKDGACDLSDEEVGTPRVPSVHDEYEDDKRFDRTRRTNRAILLCVLISLVVAVASSAAAVYTRQNRDRNGGGAVGIYGPPPMDSIDGDLRITRPPSTAPTRSPSEEPTSTPPDPRAHVLSILSPYTEMSLLLNPNVPQGKAFVRLLIEESTEAVESGVLRDAFVIEQRYALMTLGFATGMETDWTYQSGWNSFEEQWCLWHGIDSCRHNGNGHLAVSTINLANNGLVGSVPPEICILNQLERLDLSDNDLEGTLPDCIASKMTMLISLYLQTNRISGPPPTGLLTLPALVTVDLSENTFSGELDVLFGNDDASRSGSLVSLRLNNNEFTGTIPLEFIELLSLESLILTNNFLEGEVGLCALSDPVADLQVDCNILVCVCCSNCPLLGFVGG